MANMLTEYKGFELNVGVYGAAQGFIPTLTITKHHGSHTNEKRFSPPCPTNGIPDEKEALQAAIDFGKAVIDGRVKGATVQDI